MESHEDGNGNHCGIGETLVDPGESPLELLAHEEVRARVEWELQQVPEPYRTTVVLRDIEGLSYEEISEILQISLGTVKSRLIRGREALKKRLESFVRQMKSDARNGNSPSGLRTFGITPQAGANAAGQAEVEAQS